LKINKAILCPKDLNTATTTIHVPQVQVIIAFITEYSKWNSRFPWSSFLLQIDLNQLQDAAVTNNHHMLRRRYIRIAFFLHPNRTFELLV
jgi:hypothetical protein